MKSNIYTMLEKFFTEPIITIAKKFNYSEDNILILENNEIELEKQYPETYSNLLSCKHNRDCRTPMQYAQDLVCSWIFEDYLMAELENKGLEINLSGEDRNRKILKSTKVSSSSDYLVSVNNKLIYIELANDYTGYWQTKKQCDLRDDKFLHIKKGVEGADYSFLLGIDFKNTCYFLVDVNNDENNITYIPFHYAYHKPVYSINLKNIKLEYFSIDNIYNSIIDKVNEGE